MRARSGSWFSIIHQMSQGRALSRRQQEVLAEKREEFSGDWETEYRTAYRADAVLLASYYRASRLPYWQGMTTKILEVEDYVPSKRSFFKMYTNKFAQRVLEQNKAPATFAVRDAVQLRNNAHTRANFPGLAGKRGFILSAGGGKGRAWLHCAVALSRWWYRAVQGSEVMVIYNFEVGDFVATVRQGRWHRTGLRTTREP